MLNNEGKCYSFDSRGSGYGRGEGCAVIILKRVDDALQGKDPIRAIIRNTAINQDGRTSGITFPSTLAQENLQRTVYKDVAINPQSVAYVEAHGTGTVAGDMAEIEAIAKVFCTPGARTLYVGSAKTNIGHLEASSGVAGLIKGALILEKGLIPPNASFEEPKRNLRLGERNIEVT